MTWLRRLAGLPARLHGVLGAAGVIIGALSLLSFGFGLVVLVGEYHRPLQTGRAALHRVIAGWLRLDDYLGYTLIDHAEHYRRADAAGRVAARRLLDRAVTDLGDELAHHDAQFRLIRIIALDLEARGGPALASWRPEAGSTSGRDLTTDRIALTEDDPGGGPILELVVRYKVVPEVADAVDDVETSYHRLLLALIGLSGYSLLCLGYMVLHARSQRERIAREAASSATLDLADRTCHELGNVAFVVSNERRNLSGHIDLLERFVAEDAAAHAAAAARAGLDGGQADRLARALKREYADRGIDPEFELSGSATIARDVCRQIAAASDYIALTVRELDGYLKRTTLPVALGPLELGECVADALALLGPRLEAAGASVDLGPDAAAWPTVLADRRLLIHALVNLIKNAVEAAASAGTPPLVRLEAVACGVVAELAVIDNGPGIAPSDRRRIFEAGYSTKGGGRGLGLAIVRDSIAVGGGTLEVVDSPAGGRFLIRLPIAPPEGP